MGLWVLIVVFHVNGGEIINFQEFTSAERCVAAQKLIEQTARSSLRLVACLQK